MDFKLYFLILILININLPIIIIFTIIIHQLMKKNKEQLLNPSYSDKATNGSTNSLMVTANGDCWPNGKCAFNQIIYRYSVCQALRCFQYLYCPVGTIRSVAGNFGFLSLVLTRSPVSCQIITGDRFPQVWIIWTQLFCQQLQTKYQMQHFLFTFLLLH